MKNFHISDLLSVTTGRLVSTRHMEGLCDMLAFLTGDSGLFTHQLPRAFREAEPWLATQFPVLMANNPDMSKRLERFDAELEQAENRARFIGDWVEAIRAENGLPEMVPVYARPDDMHTQIDPLEELDAMVGKKKILAVRTK